MKKTFCIYASGDLLMAERQTLEQAIERVKELEKELVNEKFKIYEEIVRYRTKD